MNYQLFAFCPMTNTSMCGITDELYNNRDMKIMATFEEQ